MSSMQRRGSGNASAAAARIRVAVRVRPPEYRIPKDETRPPCVAPSPHAHPPNIVEYHHDTLNKSFTFDHVFGATATQEDVYASALHPLVAQFLDGYNVTVMAYGQTGSGKTHTMGNKASVFNTTPTTSPCRDRASSIPAPTVMTPETRAYQGSDDDGLMPRFLSDLFVNLKKEPSVREIRVTFVEIYCDNIRDLLVDHRTEKGLAIREDGHNVWVEGVRSVQVETLAKALEVLNAGRGRQAVGMNALNDESSRSHAVYTMEVTRKFQCETKKSKVTFVDLAGSERIKKTQVEGDRRKESIQINMGLSVLGNVINALAEERRAQRRSSLGSPTSRASPPETYIPYRDSKLTRLLRDGLGGNARTLIIACVSPLDSNAEETINTLQFANRARTIQNKAEKNVNHELAVVHPSSSEVEIAKLQEDVKRLLQQISDLEAAGKRRDEEILSVEEARLQRKVKKREARRDAEVATEILIYPQVDAETQHEEESVTLTYADADTMTDVLETTPAPSTVEFVDISVQFGVPYSESAHVESMTDPELPILTSDAWSTCDLLPLPTVDSEVQFGASYRDFNDAEMATDAEIPVATSEVSTECVPEFTDVCSSCDLLSAPTVDTEVQFGASYLHFNDVDIATDPVATAEASTECVSEHADAWSTCDLLSVPTVSSEVQFGTSYLHFTDVGVATDPGEQVATTEVSTECVPESADATCQFDFPVAEVVDAGIATDCEPTVETIETSTECVSSPVVDAECQPDDLMLCQADAASQYDFDSLVDAATNAIPDTADMATDCTSADCADFACQSEVFMTESAEAGTVTDSQPVVDSSTEAITVCMTDGQCQSESSSSETVEFGMTTDPAPVITTSTASTECNNEVTESACQWDSDWSTDVSDPYDSSQTVDCLGIDSMSCPAIESVSFSFAEPADSENLEVDHYAALDYLKTEDYDVEVAKLCLSPTSSTSTLSDAGGPSTLKTTGAPEQHEDLTFNLYDETPELEGEDAACSKQDASLDATTMKSAFPFSLMTGALAAAPTQELYQVFHVDTRDDHLFAPRGMDNSAKISKSLDPETSEDELVKAISKTSENQVEVGARGQDALVCSAFDIDELANYSGPVTRSFSEAEDFVVGGSFDDDEQPDEADSVAASRELPPPLSVFVNPSPAETNFMNEGDIKECPHSHQQLPSTQPAADFVVVRSPRRGSRGGQQGSAPQQMLPRGVMAKRSRSPSARPLRMFTFDDSVAAPTPEKTAVQAKHLYESLRQLTVDEFGQESNDDEPTDASVLHSISAVGQLITETKDFLQRRQQRQHRVAQLHCQVRSLEDLLQVENRAPISEPELRAYSERVQEEFLCKLLQQLVTLATERLHTRLKGRLEAERVMGLPTADANDPTCPFLSLDQCHACAEWFFHRPDDAAFFETQILPLITSGWISLTQRELDAEHAWFQL